MEGERGRGHGREGGRESGGMDEGRAGRWMMRVMVVMMVLLCRRYGHGRVLKTGKVSVIEEHRKMHATLFPLNNLNKP